MEETTHHITVQNEPCPEGARNTIGGSPILQPGQSVPCCQRCDRQLTLFLQFDVDADFNLPFADGSHFLMFACVDCEDIPSEQYSNLDKTVQETFGNSVCGHYSLYLNPPSDRETNHSHDNEIQPKQITFSKTQESIEQSEFVGKTSSDFACKVGGTASWINYSVNLNCLCGAPIVFLCQIPEGFDFDAVPGKIAQRKWHALFLGNFIYVLGCAKQCTPHSLIVVCDN